MGNVISSAIFCARSVDKAENNGQFGRWAVAAGQAKKVADYVVTLDNSIGKTTHTAVKALETASKGEKLLQYGGKALNFAAEHVNPLICVSSGIDVLMADDKESALIKNVCGLGAMFAVENTMKNHLDDVVKIKGIDKIAKKIMEFAKIHKCEKGLPAIVHGAAFVLGSCTAYNIGNKFGTLLANKVKSKE